MVQKGESLNMGIRKLALVAALGTALASAPVMAQTSSASSLSLSGARADATLQQANGQYGEESSTTTYVIGFFVILAIGLGIYFAIDNDEDGVSP